MMKKIFLLASLLLMVSSLPICLTADSATSPLFDHICIIDDQAGVEFSIHEPDPGLAVLRVTGAPYYQDYPADGIILHDGCLSWGRATYETQQVGGTIELSYIIDHCFQRASVKVTYLGQHFYYQDNDLRDSICDEVPLPRNQPAIVNASASVIKGVAPLTVDFIGEASDPEGQTISARWDFGDGQTSTELYLPHTYTRPGTYTAIFTATDVEGLESTASLTIVVDNPVVIDPPPVENEAPAVQIEASHLTTKPKRKGIIAFTARAEDADGQIESITWDFGDGTTAQGAMVQKFWRKKGQYIVSCRITDDDGAQAIASITITVKKK